MKLLFDQNLSFKLCLRLKDLFPNSQQVRLLDMSASDDRNIWRHSATNDFIIVTQDSDFADMAAVLGPPPKVVWLRCGNQPTTTIERLLREHFKIIKTFVGDETAACLEIY
jgi:predicted nuclease of predicted toxin-antitoxin system